MEELVAQWSAQLPAAGGLYAGDDITAAAPDLLIRFEQAVYRQES